MIWNMGKYSNLSFITRDADIVDYLKVQGVRLIIFTFF